MVRFSARMTSKGQITVPKAVRDLLALRSGDEVTFEVDGQGVRFDRVPTFLELAGSVDVPEELRGLSWEEIERRAEAAYVAEVARRYR